MIDLLRWAETMQREYPTVQLARLVLDDFYHGHYADITRCLLAVDIAKLEAQIEQRLADGEYEIGGAE